MFKINQKVVCVKSHSQNAVIKGRVYTIYGNNYCCTPLVDVGLTCYVSCFMPCCMTNVGLNTISWMGAELFAPLQEEKGTKTIEDFKLQMPHLDYSDITMVTVELNIIKDEG